VPYIPHYDREWAQLSQRNEGELNYAITRLCNEYLIKNGKSYGNFNAVVGVLECAKLELYRRMVAPYEDQKKELNGDVYGQ
jgi:hypothetical protein